MDGKIITRICDNCKEPIPLGANRIDVTFTGIKNAKALFKTNQLDFCSLKCLVEFWTECKQ